MSTITTAAMFGLGNTRLAALDQTTFIAAQAILAERVDALPRNWDEWHRATFGVPVPRTRVAADALYATLPDAGRNRDEHWVLHTILAECANAATGQGDRIALACLLYGPGSRREGGVLTAQVRAHAGYLYRAWQIDRFEPQPIPARYPLDLATALGLLDSRNAYILPAYPGHHQTSVYVTHATPTDLASATDEGRRFNAVVVERNGMVSAANWIEEEGMATRGMRPDCSTEVPAPAGWEQLVLPQ